MSLGLVLLVTGDRDWADLSLIRKEIERLDPWVMIEGEARGADKLARKAAEEINRDRGVAAALAPWSANEATDRPRLITIEPWPADWTRYGKAAGPIRNRQMLRRLLDYRDADWPIYCVGFHDRIEKSKGTADMLREAAKAGVDHHLCTRDGNVSVD